MNGNDAIESIHVLDVIISCYASILGKEVAPVFSETVDALQTLNNPALTRTLLQFTSADLDEQRQKVQCGQWKPSLSYIKAYVELLNALQEQRTWPVNEEYRDEMQYAVSFWIKQMYILRKLQPNQSNQVFYRGVLLPVLVLPNWTNAADDNKTRFEKVFGIGKFDSIIAQLCKFCSNKNKNKI